MSRFGSQYSVGRVTGVCAATGRGLVAGEPIVAALVESDEGLLARVDHVAEAWDAGFRPPRLFSHWRTVVPEPGERPTPFVDDEVLLYLFHRLAEDDRDDSRAFRLVIAMLLMRKRLLRFAGRLPGGGGPEIWLMRQRGQAPEAEPLRLLNPGLGDDDVSELTAQLGEILQSELG